MLFNSFEFIVFFLSVLVLYYAIPDRLRWILILGSSCVFYMAYKPSYILVLFAIIIIDYTAAIYIERTSQLKMKRLILLLSLLSNIGILFYFKYFNFVFENLTLFLSNIGVQKKFPHLEMILPVGLSFHTFQSMAYTIDVSRGKQKAEKHLGYFAGYVLFFPQMVAGPIEKYSSLGVQLRNEIVYHYENFSKGFRLILYGLFVKVVVADSIAEVADKVFASPELYSACDTWIGVLLFSVQIYADFFGYSTMAIGIAACMGIHLMDNFNNPYFASNIVEFWKRWHISLTNWFREYVYFSLGGNHVKKLRWLLNILLVFTLSGLWHGASWNFVWWGLAHGVLYLLESPLDRITIKNKILLLLMTIINFLIVSLVWVFFRAKDFKTATTIYSNLLSTKDKSGILEVPYKIPLILISFFVLEIAFNKSRVDKYWETKNVILRWVFYSILIVLIFLYSEIKTKPFIYFQF
jgi:alginate O-acetyltransferase complex protein AlgI